MAIPSKQQPIKNKPATVSGAVKSGSRPATTQSTGRELVKESSNQFPLARRNFIFMIAAGALILIGFLLMLGSGSTPEKFNPDIFSTRRIVIGPTLAFLGFVFMGIAIIIKPGKATDKSSDKEAAMPEKAPEA